MAKIPFDIKYRPQIESGEYKVCINYDWPVEILSWDCIHVNRKGKHFPILAKITCLNPGEENDFIHWYNNEGKYDPWDCISSAIQDNDCIAYCPGHDLFIVTPEEELTEFEKVLGDIVKEAVEKEVGDNAAIWAIGRGHAEKLLALAREELFANDAVLKEYAQVSREQGKAEALRTRATELTENLVKSGLDKDSIPYHLIEFMCNLYDCKNWKEIEDTAEAYATRLKAAAMKDLPRSEDKETTIKTGDRVLIHCKSTRDKALKHIYDNQEGEVLHVWDLKGNPWGNIHVRIEGGYNNGFLLEEHEKLPGFNE